MTAPIHEVIVGPAGPTRKRMVANRIADDLIHLTTECWLIDLYGTHPEQTIKAARTLPDARAMLAGLNRFTPNDRGQGLCITIADTSLALEDPALRRNLEDILRARSTASIKFRFVVPNLSTPNSFGGSKVIFGEMKDADIIEAMSR